jgi:hypothetical protein
MIKNPTIGQLVYFIEDESREIPYVSSGIVTIDWSKEIGKAKAVEINCWHYRKHSEIFPTKESAEKYLPKAYEKALKTLNKQIFDLSKQREKIATKLAGLKT